MIWVLCRHEAIKLFSQKYPFVLFAFVLVFQIIMMLVSALTPPETTLEVVTAPQLWAQGSGLGLRFGVYLILVIGAMGFSQEFSQGTVKTILVLPVKRWHWVLAKLLFLALLAMIILLIISVTGILIVAFTIGWQDVVREGVVLYKESAVWLALIKAVALTLVFLLPLCAFSLLAGLHFNSSGAAVGTALMLGIVLEAAVGLIGGGKYVFLYHLHRPINMIEKLGKGLPFQWDNIIFWGLGSTIATFIVFTVWLVVKMEKMDITA